MVLYIEEWAFDTTTPHYFVVLNVDPQSDEVVLLACATSQIASREAAARRNGMPPSTLVQVEPSDYPSFKVTSLFDCNTLHRYTMAALENKQTGGFLQVKPMMPMEVVEKLRQAAIESPQTTGKQRRMLRQPAAPAATPVPPPTPPADFAF
jgi:hypothetical protein